MPKKHLAFFCVTLILVLVTSPVWGFSRVPPEPSLVPGKLIVKFKGGVSEDQRIRIIEKEGGTVKSVLTTTGVHIIILPESVDVPDAVKRFSSYPEVLYAEPVQHATPLEVK